MKETTKEAVKVDVVTNVFCNKCGESCRVDKDKDLVLRQRNVGLTRKAFYGLVEATVTSGYYSPFFMDGRLYRFSLCEACLQALFDTFKIPVEMEELF